MRGYVTRTERNQKNKERTDWLFDEDPNKAMYWPSESEAAIDRDIWNRNRVHIPSALGGDFICDFEIEKLNDDTFVMFCEGPFILKRSSQ